MHSTSHPATIIQRDFLATVVVARSLLQLLQLLLPLPIGCLASR